MQSTPTMVITASSWSGDHSASINVCTVWGTRAGVQVSRKEFYTHIYLDYIRVKILSCIKKKKKKKSICGFINLKRLIKLPTVALLT